MYIRVYTDIPSSYSCGLFAGNVALSRGHTRLTRLQLYSLRGLSCLLQKHRLRYTIKLPSSVRGLVSLLSFFSLASSFLPFLARSLFNYPFVPIGWLSHQPPVLLSLPLLSWYTTWNHHREKCRDYLVVVSNCTRLIFLLHLSFHYLLNIFVKLLSLPSTHCLCKFLYISRE